MEKKLAQARLTIQQRKENKNRYVKNWRVGERARKRTSYFVAEYVKEKFNNVYCEALCFYDALNKLYPEKPDLRKTKEFRKWKKTVSDGNNEKLAGTVQILTTETTLNEGHQDQIQITRFTSQTVIQSNSNSEQSDEQTYGDNLVLEIPLLAHPAQTQAPPDDNPTLEIPPPQPQAPPENNPTVQAPPENNPTVQAPPENNPTVQIPPENNPTVQIPPVQIPPVDEITDERIREIIEELRNDPDLDAIFNDPQPEISEQDEGIELPSLEEEMEADIEPFDYHMEVELESW